MSSVAAEISPAGELQTLLASRVPLVIIESREEGRVIELVRDAALRAQRGRNWGVFQWTVTEGLLRVDVDMGGSQRTLAQPEQLLKHIKATTMAGIYVLLDFHPYLENPLFVRALKDIAQEYDRCARTLVLLSAEIKVPADIEHLAAHFSVRAPDKDERHAIIMNTAREWAKLNGAMPRVDVKAVSKLVDNLAGLALHDVKRLVRQAIFPDGALSEDDIKPLLAAKYQLLNRGGTLSFEADTAQFADIGGLKNLRRWIAQRKAAFDGSATSPYDEDAPAAPLNVYGQSKLDGERAIVASDARALILRTSWVYGLRGKNFLLTIRRLAAERDELKIVADQAGTPNWARTLAIATADLVARGLPYLDERTGLYHFSSTGATTWHGFAAAIIGDARTPKVTPITTAEYPTPARRPMYGVLATARFRAAFDYDLPPWRDALAACLASGTQPAATN